MVGNTGTKVSITLIVEKYRNESKYHTNDRVIQEVQYSLSFLSFPTISGIFPFVPLFPYHQCDITFVPVFPYH
jgi:hypothetical protein